MKALLKADRAAAKRHGFRYSTLRGAPSHTGAFLLQELEALGWALTPVAPELGKESS